MDKRDKRVRFLAKLPPDLHRWLKVTAAQRGIDMNALLVASLDSARLRLGEKGETGNGTSDH